MPRKPLGNRPLTNAERQARHRAARAASRPVNHYRPAADRRSRAQRWRDAVAELVTLQSQYAQWFEADIERAAAEDPDASLTTAGDWKDVRVVWPQTVEPVTLRLERDVLAWFRRQGRGYQARIIAVLRAFVKAQER
jgi:uncharacterized protein (DUF4415 family)